MKFFTATQIPGIANRVFPKELAGKNYKKDIPIFQKRLLDNSRSANSAHLRISIKDIYDILGPVTRNNHIIINPGNEPALGLAPALVSDPRQLFAFVNNLVYFKRFNSGGGNYDGFCGSQVNDYYN